MGRKGFWSLAVLILAAVLLLSACGAGASQPQPTQAPAPAGQPTQAAPAAQEAGKSRLDVVLERGKLICGVNDKLPGFGYPDPKTGEIVGFDADFCRAVAAALFNDPSKVEFRPLTAKERFTAVQTGEVDVVFRNTTWTAGRDGAVGMDFGPTTFYDGQGIMVRKDSGIKSLEDLRGGTICTNQGTTTELNITDQMRKRNIDFTLLTFEDFDKVMAAFDQGRCDAVTTDKSGLVARKATHANPESLEILDITLSKEPLGPMMAQNDSKWRDVIVWVVFGTIQAEELGITSQNVDEFLKSDDPVIRRLLGVEGDLGQGLGVSNDFIYRVIKHVGNYGEIYDRNLGPNTPFNLPRGLNDLWTRGGLLYSPPFR